MGIAQRLSTRTKKYILAMATNAVYVSMESWTTMSDRGDGTGQVGTVILVSLMCIKTIFLLYVL